MTTVHRIVDVCYTLNKPIYVGQIRGNGINRVAAAKRWLIWVHSLVVGGAAAVLLSVEMRANAS